jgi:putative MATE family efflux protein
VKRDHAGVAAVCASAPTATCDTIEAVADVSATRRFDRTIVDGPLSRAVWMLAWPTMLQNAIAGLQGMVDHTLVGHYVGYTGNAAIGVSWQIFLVVITFMASLYTGTSVLVARYAGAGDADRVNRTVYQAFLTSLLLAVFVLAPIGYFFAPGLLDIVHAAPEVKHEALPFLRIMFVFSVGLLIFFMLGGAFRAAGDARTPMVLGVVLTILNAGFNIVLIRGLGPIPAFGTRGAAIGTVTASAIVGIIGLGLLFSGRSVIRWSWSMSWRPDWVTIRALFAFGLPAGFQGIAMNIAGVLLLRFIGSLDHSAEAQAAYAVGYGELFSLITWTSVGLMGAAATVVGQNMGAGRPDRSVDGPKISAGIGVGLAFGIGLLFVFIPGRLLGLFGMTDPIVLGIGSQLLRYLCISGLFVTVALSYTGALQGSGDTRSPLVISLISQIAIPLGLCATIQAFRPLQPADIWRAIVLGHVTRCTLSFLRFRQGKWRTIAIPTD